MWQKEEYMTEVLKEKATEIIKILDDIPDVKNCTIYGSLSANTSDSLSDIDIQIDVSGVDNGKFMLGLVEILKPKLKIYYSDYAPSLVPDRYIVSIAIDESNPFLIVDLCCVGNLHYTTVTKQDVKILNNNFAHILKLWTANLKHFVRNKDCYDDILRMAEKINLKNVENKNALDLLSETLVWLENNVEDHLANFVASCRKKFNELTKKH